MRIGGHLPARSGLRSAIDAAETCGAQAVQLFVSNPRAWAPPRISEQAAREFREAWADSGLGPLYAHAPYVMNIASPNARFRQRTADLGRASVAACEAIGADGFVVHAGSGGEEEPERALGLAAATLRAICAEAERAAVVVELTAGTAGSVAATFTEAARLFAEADEGSLRLCADTCHLFAAGYGLDEPDGVRACFQELRASGLAGRLVLVHANDAKHPRGSHRDRHEHVGEGFIGREGFREILARQELAQVAVVAETPGKLDDLRRNIELLRELAGRDGASRPD